MERTKTRRWSLLVMCVMAVTVVATGAQADPYTKGIVVQPKPDEEFRIWIWPDRGEGGEYLPGETIRINVEVTRDCFLILYDIDTRGNFRILFPYDPWDDNFVAAGDVVTFPRPWDGYEWSVEGPSGIEYVQAIASEFPIRPPDWPIYMRSVNHGGAICPDPEIRDFRAGNDRLDYIRVVNRKITGRFWDWCATDLATFYVRPHYHRRVWYQPDPWPDVFFGEIYIGWPIGGRIYIDNIYIGVAPCWIPRRYVHGQHVLVCRQGDRVIHRQTVHYYPKREYTYKYVPGQRDVIVERGSVKSGRRGGTEYFRTELERDSRSRELRKKHPTEVLNKPGRVEIERGRGTSVTPERSRTVERDRGHQQVTTTGSTSRTVEVDRDRPKRASNNGGRIEPRSSGVNSSNPKVAEKPRLEVREERTSSGGSLAADANQRRTVEAKSETGTRAKVKSDDDSSKKRTTVKRSGPESSSKTRAKADSGKRRK